MSAPARAAHPPSASRREVIFVGRKGAVASRVQQALKRRPFSISFHATPSEALATSRREQAPALYVVSLFDDSTQGARSAGRKKSFAVSLLHFVRDVSSRHPHVPVVIAADEPSQPKVIERAIELGASDVISQFDTTIGSLVETRLDTILNRSVSAQSTAQSAAPGVKASPAPNAHDTVSAAEASQALARVRARVASLPARAARRQPLATVLDITTPELRAKSGRLDAQRIADRLGVSLRSVARAAGVSHQALSATPDSKRAQERLDAIARALGNLDALLPQGNARAWLHTPHSRLKGATPLEALLDGRAERVATMLSVAREGGVA